MHRRRASRLPPNAAVTSTSVNRFSRKSVEDKRRTANLPRLCTRGTIKVGYRSRWARPRSQGPGARQWSERSESCGEPTLEEVRMSAAEQLPFAPTRREAGFTFRETINSRRHERWLFLLTALVSVLLLLVPAWPL